MAIRKFIRNALLFLLWAGIIRTTWAQQPKDYSSMEIQASRHWLDIDYVGDGHIGHRLDIHLPETKTVSYPVVISVYGSAWFSNNLKGTTFHTGLGQYLLQQGFAVISVNYRSSHDALFPAQLHDIKAAIRYIRAKGPEFGLETTKMGITGWSSGGHLAAMAGTTSNKDSAMVAGNMIDLEGSLGGHVDIDSSVQAVVDFFGPTDFLIMDECGSSFSHDAPESPESSLIGGPIQENKELAAQADPASYAGERLPPFLIFHGDKDPLVPHCQSEHLHQAIQDNGQKSELLIIEGGGHGPGVMIDTYYARMASFFKAHLQ